MTGLILWHDTSDQVNETICCALMQIFFWAGITWVSGTVA